MKLKKLFEDDRRDTQTREASPSDNDDYYDKLHSDMLRDHAKRVKRAKRARHTDTQTREVKADSNADTEPNTAEDLADARIAAFAAQAGRRDDTRAKARSSKLTDTGDLAGTPFYTAPEYLRAAGYRGNAKTKKVKQGWERSRFGKKAIATEKNPLPPFPYHPGELRDKYSKLADKKSGDVEKNAVTDPESQIYYVLESEGPLHWKDIFAKIVPYLKELSAAGGAPPQFDAYGEAVVNLLKRGVIKKTTEGKYYSSF